MRTIKDKILDRLILARGHVFYRKIINLVDKHPPYISKTQAAYLCSLIKPGDVVLDIGSGNGLSSAVMASRGAQVHSFEWFKGIQGVSDKDVGFQEGNFSSNKQAFLAATSGLNVILHEGDCLKTIPELIDEKKLTGFSLAFIDIDLYHLVKGSVAVIARILQKQSVICIHDYSSSGVVKAVKELLQEYPLRIRREYPLLTLKQA